MLNYLRISLVICILLFNSIFADNHRPSTLAELQSLLEQDKSFLQQFITDLNHEIARINYDIKNLSSDESMRKDILKARYQNYIKLDNAIQRCENKMVKRLSENDFVEQAMQAPESSLKNMRGELEKNASFIKNLQRDVEGLIRKISKIPAKRSYSLQKLYDTYDAIRSKIMQCKTVLI